MPSTDRNDPDEIRRRSRADKTDDEQGIGEPEEGVRLPVSGYAEDDDTSFLGVDEPVVAPDDQGTPPPATSLPSGDDQGR